MISLSASGVALVLLWGAHYVVVIPLLVSLVLFPLLIIHIASHLSLAMLNKSHNAFKDREVISTQAAYTAPVTASLALGGLYLVFKYANKETVQLVILCYFALMSAFVIASTLIECIPARLLSDSFRFGDSFELPWVGKLDLRVHASHIVCVVLSIMLAGLYFYTNHYMLNNLIAICLAMQAIASVSVGSFRNAAILLSGLFFYDIFWVFGTDVMMTVATSFDAPVKIVFPKEIPATAFSLLGLGDIVVPGLLIALLLRYDASRVMSASDTAPPKNFARPYYLSNLAAYVAGLAVTHAVMMYFRAGQPALLYLVPACLGTAVAAATYLGDIKGLLAYSEESSDSSSEEIAASVEKKQE